MWSDSNKNRFFDQVKDAVQQGATAEDLVKELEGCYYQALDDMRKHAEYEFKQLLKNRTCGQVIVTQSCREVRT